jgi:hypothetical protein
MITSLFHLHFRAQRCLEELRASAIDCLEELRQSGDRQIGSADIKQKLVNRILAKADDPLGHTVARKIIRHRVRAGATLMEGIEWAEQIIDNIDDEIRRIENRQMVTLAGIAVALSIVAVLISVISRGCT